MKRKTRKALHLAAEHAARAVHALIARGELKARDVASALKRRRKLIKELKKQLAAQKGGAMSAVAPSRRVAPRKAARKRPRPSATRLHAGRAVGAAARVVRRKTIARPTRIKASRPGVAIKTAVAKRRKRHAGTGPRPITVEARAKTIAR